MKPSFFYPSLFCLLVLTTACSGAVPNSGDVKRVKKDYLSLRFQRPFHPALRDLSDRELMALSCQKNQVQCSKLLKLLGKKDKEFYKKFKALLEQ